MTGAETELREELVKLRAALARRLRARLESEDAITPAWMDQARRFLDQERALLEAPPAPALPPVVRDLPFTEPEPE